MITDIVADLSNVAIIPENEYAEIIQNVKTILLTHKGTTPLDRAFGIDGRFIDEPISAARARASAEIVSAIHSQEPRAKVKKVLFDGELSGYLGVRVRIEI